MDITLYNNRSEKNKIHKSLTNGYTLSGALRDECNITNPEVRINTSPVGYDYAYIPSFGRYYYISSFTVLRSGIWVLSLVSDPLMSFADDIDNAEILLINTESTAQETYLPGEAWKANSKASTDIISFPNGLNSSGEYILITSGGIATVSGGGE